MELKWSAIVERYVYENKVEQRAHKEIMKQKGYEDTGLSSAVVEESGEYHRTYCGEYRKYTFRK